MEAFLLAFKAIHIHAQFIHGFISFSSLISHSQFFFNLIYVSWNVPVNGDPLFALANKLKNIKAALIN